MSSDKIHFGFGTMKRLELERQRAEKERAEAEKPQTEGTANLSVPDKLTVPDKSTVPANESGTANGVNPVPPLAVPDSLAVPVKLAVPDTVTVPANLAATPAKAGYLRVPNALLDDVFPTLDPSELAVWLRLYRLSYGYSQETCLVGMPALARATRLSERSVLRTVNALCERGLIERLADKRTGANTVRGNIYRVVLPPGVPANLTGTVNLAGTDKSAGTARLATNKDSLKKHEKSAPVAVAPAPEFSVYDVRRIAARFRELHHGESDYTKDKLKADVRTTLIGEGREPDDRLIDEAIGA